MTSTVSRCIEEEYRCRSGSVVVVMCSGDPFENPRAASSRQRFRALAPGSLSMAYEDDWRRGYYVYYYPGVGGFYMEGDMDAFDDPECRDLVVPVFSGFYAPVACRLTLRGS